MEHWSLFIARGTPSFCWLNTAEHEKSRPREGLIRWQLDPCWNSLTFRTSQHLFSLDAYLPPWTDFSCLIRSYGLRDVLEQIEQCVSLIMAVSSWCAGYVSLPKCLYICQHCLKAALWRLLMPTIVNDLIFTSESARVAWKIKPTEPAAPQIADLINRANVRAFKTTFVDWSYKFDDPAKP